MAKNIQYQELLPNMYTKIRYITWYTLNKKEEAQFPIRHKQKIIQEYTHQSKKNIADSLPTKNKK